MREKFGLSNRAFPWEFAEKRGLLFYPDWKENEKPHYRMAGDILEIGPGQGYLLLGQAKSNPDKKYLAVEFGKRRYYRIVDRIQKLGIANIQLIAGLAQTVVPRCVASGCLERAYVLFPDPWPKSRHAQNRLLTSDFMAVLACTLKTGGELIVATDYRSYADWVIKNGDKVPSLSRLGTPYCHQKDVPDYIPTYFEKKWRDEGKEIYFLRFQKTDTPVCTPIR